MKIAIVFSGHLRDTCENKMLPNLTHSFLSDCSSEFLCDVFIHTWMTIDKNSKISSLLCLKKLEELLAPKGIIREYQLVTDIRKFGWANENLQSFQMNIAGMHG
jgi:hypothetical protein